MQHTQGVARVAVGDGLQRKRDFRILLAGSSVSMLGSRLTAVAYPLLILALTQSPLIAGWAGFAVTVSNLVLYLPVGALVDRWDPRHVMLVSEFCRGATVATLVIMIVSGSRGVLVLIILAVVEQAFAVFSTLSEWRFVRLLVGPDNVASSLAQSEARKNLVLLLGRPLGGLLFGLERFFPFLADALSFCISAGTLLWLGQQRPPQPLEWAPRRSLVHEIRDGLRWLIGDPLCRIAFPLTAFTTLVSQALMMVFLAEAWAQHLAPGWIGAVLAASGVGGIAGSAAAVGLFRRFSYNLLPIQIWVWTGAFVFLALSGGKPFIIMAATLIITGFAGALGNVAIDTYLLRNARPEMLGRITSVDRMTSYGALALGPLLGGFLASRYGIPLSLYVLLAAVLLMAVMVAAGRDNLRPPASAEALPDGTPAQTGGPTARREALSPAAPERLAEYPLA
jgi:MFS family permease